MLRFNLRSICVLFSSSLGSHVGGYNVVYTTKVMTFENTSRYLMTSNTLPYGVGPTQ